MEFFIDRETGHYVTEKEVGLFPSSEKYIRIRRGLRDDYWVEHWKVIDVKTGAVGQLGIAYSNDDKEFAPDILYRKVKEYDIYPVCLLSIDYPSNYYDELFKDILKEDKNEETQKTEQKGYDQVSQKPGDIC